MNKPAALPSSTSFFLDLLRIVAAFSVFFTHLIQLWYPRNYTAFEDRLGFRSVIIFFVLSGYVITYATLRRESDPRSYVVARLSRLYSVVLPAIVLTALLQMVGTMLSPSLYHHAERGHDALRYGLAAFFLQSVWLTSTSPPTNGPFWSLSYEFWYYGLFGAAVLIKSWRWKIGAILALALACGPNILLLMPSWVLGAVCYRFRSAIRLPTAIAAIGLLLTLALAVTTYPLLPDWPYAEFSLTLFYSSAFVSDFIFGILITLLIWFFDQAFRDFRLPDGLVGFVRWLGDHTFSLYLYHFPLLFFIAAVVPFDRSHFLIAAFLILLTLVAILGLSVFTESRRPLWRKFFGTLWDRAVS